MDCQQFSYALLYGVGLRIVRTPYMIAIVGGLCLLSPIGATEADTRRLKIEGDIVISGVPVPGVSIVADNGGTSDVTDAQGRFTVEVPYGWIGSLTPTKAGWEFDPPHKMYHNITEDLNECTPVRHDSPPSAISLLDPSVWWDPAPPSPARAPGRFGVVPVMLSLESDPGNEVREKLMLQCMGTVPAHVTVSLSDLEQQSDGQLIPVASAHATCGRPRSCRHWITLVENSPDTDITMAPVDHVEVPIVVRVPEGTRGLYHAAVVVELRGTEQGLALCHQFVVPVWVHVKGDPVVQDVRIVDLEVVSSDRDTHPPTAMARLHIENRGGTFPQVLGSTRIAFLNREGLQEHYRLDFEGIRILPGARLSLESDYFETSVAEKMALTGHITVSEDLHFQREVALASGPEQDREASELEVSGFRSMMAGSIDRIRNLSTTFVYTDFGHRLLVSQHARAPDPFRTYTGSLNLGMATNIDTVLRATAKPCSPAEGHWMTRLSADTVSERHCEGVDLFVCGTDVRIDKLSGGAKDVFVAEITIHHIPHMSVFDDFSQSFGSLTYTKTEIDSPF